jgi:hypothetical protein
MRRHHSKNLHVVGKIILKWILEKCGWRMKSGFVRTEGRLL